MVWGGYLDAVGIALSGWLTPSSPTVICVEHDVLIMNITCTVNATEIGGDYW